MLKRLAVATAVVTALAGLAACGTSNDNTKTDTSSRSSTPDTGSHNDADVTFATSMIPHHQQALEMVDLTDGRTLDPAVRQLADQIKAAQSPEIDTMTGWLTDWGKPVPSDTSTGDDSHDMGGMDMGSQEMPGMMSAEDMANLKGASGTDFQDMWLQMMIRHHEGAITMAKTELSDGAYRPAQDLAQSIIDGQEAEIDQMKQLLGS
jgi:uncharacterized protein (DUF305 family)